MRRPPGGRIPPRPARGPAFALASPRGFALVPPTRGPDRLLGPCFKTGRQGSRQSPADPGRPGAADSGPVREPPARRHRERSRRAGLDRRTGRPGPAAQPPLSAGPEAAGEGGGARGQARPVVPPSAGRPARPRPVSRLSDRPPRRGAGLAGGTPTGRPLPARPRRSRAPRPGEVHAAGRGGAPGPRPPARGVRGRGGHRAGRAESPGPDLRGPPVCFSTASRTLELSLQSAFQLSLTVLVLYRSRAGI